MHRSRRRRVPPRRWCRRRCRTWRPPAAATSCSRSRPFASASATPWSPSSTASSMSSSSSLGSSGAQLSRNLHFSYYLLDSISLAIGMKDLVRFKFGCLCAASLGILVKIDVVVHWKCVGCDLWRCRKRLV